MTANISIESHKNLNLASYTTLKIGGNAECAYFPANSQEVLEVINSLKAENKKITVIGAGSNLLVSSKGVSGGVIFSHNLKNIEVEGCKVKVGCGAKSAHLAKILLERQFSRLRISYRHTRLGRRSCYNEFIRLMGRALSMLLNPLRF
ncbi:MAG: FAD-binding protein [Desulfomicrobium escambiense]|nr:FAD-binding protein [Desulfomicrobium escambiense]